MKISVKSPQSSLLFLLLFCLLTVNLLWARDRIDRSFIDPEVTSVFPLGGNPGTTVEAEVRGKFLDGAYAIWFDDESLKAQVKKVEEVELDDAKRLEPEGKRPELSYRILLQVEISPVARIGPRQLRLVSQRGVSNALLFQVNSDPVIAETESPHGKPSQAQQVGIPAVVNGNVSKSGELDYYLFEVSKDQELTFECFSDRGFDPQLALYEPSGSWFDPHRATRLAFNDEPASEFTSTSPRLTYRFNKAGRYLVEVSAFLGNSLPHSPYQLRIAPTSSPLYSTQTKDPGWHGHSFTRKIAPGWLQELWSRTVRTSAFKGNGGRGTTATSLGKGELPEDETSVELSDFRTILAPVIEEEPNELPMQTSEIPIPTIIEGAIDRPGDVDHFRLNVKRGESLVFEIETPQAAPPEFNPRLDVLSDSGRELATNIYKRIGRNFTFYLKTVQPKTAYTFEQAGECILQIRDITSRVGGPRCQYRLLIRQRIPHVGEIQVKEDRLNLVLGEARKLTVMTAQEEGFSGDIALNLEGLPPGVDAFPGTEVKPDKGAPPDEGYKERFLPKTENATVILMATANAAISTMPHSIRIVGRPIVEGQPGSPLAVREILLMVVKRTEPSSSGDVSPKTGQ
ncbi:MAG: hypothetical protein EXQ58_07445 [Acidobacteria bacterium]|nr:hypothetical protein [Acidobacteriota bacterium]